jgi:hypothetical protein
MFRRSTRRVSISRWAARTGRQPQHKHAPTLIDAAARAYGVPAHALIGWAGRGQAVLSRALGS